MADKLHYALAASLIVMGLHGMLLRPHLVRKLLAMNVLQVGVIMFFLSLSVKIDGGLPILAGHGAAAPPVEQVMNPLPHALMLTAIVVSVSTTGVALAILIRIHRLFGTLDEGDLLERLRR